MKRIVLITPLGTFTGRWANPDMSFEELVESYKDNVRAYKDRDHGFFFDLITEDGYAVILPKEIASNSIIKIEEK